MLQRYRPATTRLRGASFVKWPATVNSVVSALDFVRARHAVRDLLVEVKALLENNAALSSKNETLVAENFDLRVKQRAGNCVLRRVQ